MRSYVWAVVLLAGSAALNGQCTILQFNAKTGQPPKPVKNPDEKETADIKKPETGPPANPVSTSIAKTDCDSYSHEFLREKNTEVRVLHRRFGDVFSVQIDKVVSVGTGIIEIRGLDPDQIKPLEENTGGVPISRGGNIASEVQIDEIKRADVITDLLNERILGATRAKLLAQLESLRLAKRGLERDRDDLKRRIHEISGDKYAEPAGASPDLATLLESIKRERLAIPKKEVPARASALKDELGFVDRVRRTDRSRSTTNRCKRG